MRPNHSLLGLISIFFNKFFSPQKQQIFTLIYNYERMGCVRTISGHICEKHEAKHQITYGESEPKLAVTQHFSLGSPEFVRFAKKELPSLKKDFIATGIVSWTFCPYVADVTTIQLSQIQCSPLYA